MEISIRTLIFWCIWLPLVILHIKQYKLEIINGCLNLTKKVLRLLTDLKNKYSTNPDDE